jgi:hypothetical protein
LGPIHHFMLSSVPFQLLYGRTIDATVNVSPEIAILPYAVPCRSEERKGVICLLTFGIDGEEDRRGLNTQSLCITVGPWMRSVRGQCHRISHFQITVPVTLKLMLMALMPKNMHKYVSIGSSRPTFFLFEGSAARLANRCQSANQNQSE